VNDRVRQFPGTFRAKRGDEKMKLICIGYLDEQKVSEDRRYVRAIIKNVEQCDRLQVSYQMPKDSKLLPAVDGYWEVEPRLVEFNNDDGTKRQWLSWTLHGQIDEHGDKPKS